VAPGSFADASGVRPGDVLVRVNQTAIRSAEDVSTALRQVRRGDMLRVDVRRYENGSVQSLTIVQPAR
jgi:type II secretory pathway component PulC